MYAVSSTLDAILPEKGRFVLRRLRAMPNSIVQQSTTSSEVAALLHGSNLCVHNR
jgi:hypothetical protein